MIDDVYDGFVQYYPHFSNDFNDDHGWWALGSARAYELIGDTRYKNRAVDLFARMWTHWDNTYGGGIWWKNDGSHSQKNVATNAPAAITAVKLYNITGDSTYLDKAEQLYNWVTNRLVDSDGHVYDHIEGSGNGTLVKWDFTYNFGTYIGAALELYQATGQTSYLNDAVSVADWAVNNLDLNETLLREGVNDSGGFKMIFARHLNRLVEEEGQTQYLDFLQNNATQAWNHRRSDNLIGPDWSAPAPSGFIQSLTAASGAAILQFVDPNGYSGIIEGDGEYEGENAVKNSLTTESTQSGYPVAVSHGKKRKKTTRTHRPMDRPPF